jgi:ubiquinone/menaquinone biosynthesis C-methylase UbiE
MKIGKQRDPVKQKYYQKIYMDNIFKSRFRDGSKSFYKESLIGNFIEYYTLKEALSLLPFKVRNMVVLSICCGDGFEGEYLHRLGARVTVSDFSPEAVKAARRRCKYLRGVVADAENLPFKDNSFDLVLVRHGLHHIPHPYKGLSEMNRISKKGFVFIEAQRNFITKIFINLKLASEYEESGNFVYRFTRDEIKKFMKRINVNNYKISTSWCYHVDFLTEQIYPRFNSKITLLVFTLLFSFFNSLFGYFGNSMVVVALKN